MTVGQQPLRTQAISRLQVLLCRLIAGGLPRQLSADRAARALRNVHATELVDAQLKRMASTESCNSGASTVLPGVWLWVPFGTRRPTSRLGASVKKGRLDLVARSNVAESCATVLGAPCDDEWPSWAQRGRMLSLRA